LTNKTNIIIIRQAKKGKNSINNGQKMKKLTELQKIHIKDIKKLAYKSVSIMLKNKYSNEFRNLEFQRIWNEANAKIERIKQS
jgi:hypothetical protein